MGLSRKRAAPFYGESMTLDLKKIIECILLAVITGSFGGVARYAEKISQAIDKVDASVQELNAKIEVLTVKVLNNDAVQKDHEARLRQQERAKLK